MMNKLFAKLNESEFGATAIEYGIIVALLSLAGIAGFQLVGGQINTNFNNLDTTIERVNDEMTEANNLVN